MAQIFNIQDDKVVISKLEIAELSGNVKHSGTLLVAGDTSVSSNLNVAGVITADILNVKTIISETPTSHDSIYWVTNTEPELSGKGLRWAWGEAETQLVYRSGNRLWTNSSLDLQAESSYNIDNIPVLTSDSLGTTVTKSNLRQVGPLNSLNVIGDVSISEFAFFNSISNRLGLGTDEPSASITILDNDVEISIGSPKVGVAYIGTSSNHDLSITSDNIPRLTVKYNGEVHISDEVNKSGVLRIFGTLYADNVVSDTRIERTSPLEFKETPDSSIYGNGLVWSGYGKTRQLIMMSNPERIWCSESFDIGQDQAYYINGTPILNEISLGKTVLYSSLIRVGNLESLQVNGDASILGELNVQSGVIKADKFYLNDGVDRLAISSKGFDASNSINVTIQGLDTIFANDQEIVFGSKQSSRRAIKVFGQLTVGVNNPDPTVSLAVNGNISFANKKFITGIRPPIEGNFLKGDICWNQQPQEDGYVGWVCVTEGSPGMWAPFGAIGRNV